MLQVTRFKSLLVLTLVAAFLMAAESLQAESVAPFFGVSPTKVEMMIKPGARAAREIHILNQLGGPARFTLSTADYTADADTGGVDILDGEAGFYSLRRYFNLSDYEFTLDQGETKTVSVAVSLPTAASVAGSLHGVVLVSGERMDRGQAAAKLASQAGILFFIQVEGRAQVEGRLTNLAVAGGRWHLNPDRRPTVNISYHNTGNTYLNPYGLLTVKNMISQKKMFLSVEPWFVLPHSERTKSIELTRQLGSGLYQVQVEQNRGYDDIIDTDTTWLVIISPWLLVLGLLLGLLLTVYLLKKHMLKLI